MTSPLSFIINDEKVDQILEHLRLCAQQGLPLNLSNEDTHYIKKKFKEGVEIGEKKLHDLSFQLMRDLGNISEAKATLIVWGRCFDPSHPEINKSYTNIELTNVMSSKYMDSIIAWTHSPLCKICHQKTNVIASFNQYKFDKNYPSGLKILLSRIKTTSNICYKIADIVFDIDRMFQRDKIVNKYMQTLMDMYGIKIAFQERQHIFNALDYLKSQPDIEILDEKNYLDANRKKSGYEAYKLTIKKENQIFELQLQTLNMLEVEKSQLNASHKTYKEKQMEDRKKMGEKYMQLHNVLLQLFSEDKNFMDYSEEIEN